MKNYISLGAGVQSSTMALMAALGIITPMPDAAIFADTQAEPHSVYAWLDWLEKQLPYPVYRVTHGSLAADSIRVRRSKKSGKLYSKGGIPVFVQKPDGEPGLMWRRCTGDYKINPVHRKYRELLGLRRMKAKSTPVLIQWIGISRDEIIRMKPSKQSWIENRWPLVDMGITRADCFAWMNEHGFPKPPRSACVFCPYHDDAEWVRLKTDEPREFERAVKWEKAYRKAVARDEVTDGVPFLHRSLVTIDKVIFHPTEKKADQFGNECEGRCGV